MDIKIRKDGYGHMTANEGAVSLFDFEYRAGADAWYFWMPGRAFEPQVFQGKRFPMPYFIDACRACHFIRTGEGLDDFTVNVAGVCYTIID